MGVTPRRNTHRTFAVPRTNFGKKRSWAAITCALAKQLARAPLSLAAGTCAGNSVELLRESAAITCCASTCRLVSTQNVKTSTAPRHAHSDRKRLQSSPHAACPGTWLCGRTLTTMLVVPHVDARADRCPRTVSRVPPSPPEVGTRNGRLDSTTFETSFFWQYRYK